MKITGLDNYRGRNPNGYFQDLPWGVRQRAYTWLNRFMRRWRGRMTPWRFAILVGQSKRLALMSDDELSAWGRSMHASAAAMQCSGATGTRAESVWTTPPIRQPRSARNGGNSASRDGSSPRGVSRHSSPPALRAPAQVTATYPVG
jgi:hypothetical protein